MTDSADRYDSKLLLGRYRVVRKLGEGGMGTVHLARLEGADGFTRPVVVKMIRGDLRATEEGSRLFKREAQILSKMQHPAITNILDFGVEDGAHIMVLEYVHGYTLATWLDYRHVKNHPVPVDICIYIVRRILDALHYAHHFDTEEGHKIEIVHRDVAPDNVLLAKKGHVHLLDFGIASMSGGSRGNATNSDVFRGKLGYSAPETIEGKPATPLSDQYSAAVLLLELLTLDTPFFSESVGETVLRMVNEIPAPPSGIRRDIPAGLDEILAEALEKDPALRFESARVFARELRQIQSEDDEEVAQRLRSAVRVDFENLSDEVDVEPLRFREEALARVFPKEVTQSLTDSLVSKGSGGSADDYPTLPAAPGKNDRRLHSLLLGLLVVGGVIALALGAAVALLSRDGGFDEQVVVVGAESQGAKSKFDESGDDAVLSEEGASSPTLDHLEPSSASEIEAAKSKNPTRLAPSSTAKKTKSKNPESRQRLLAKAVQSQSSAFQACFSKYLETAEKAPEAFLHFAVGALGGNATVTVEPASIASTAMGACLKTAGARAVFPSLDEKVSFRVPVRARFAKLK